MSDYSSSRGSKRISVERDPESAEKDEKVGSGAIVMVSMLSSVGACAVLFFAQRVRTGGFYGFGAYVLSTMEQPGYMDYVANGSLLAALGLFLASFITATASMFGKHGLAKFGLVLTLVMAVMVIVGGGIILDFVSGSDSSGASLANKIEGDLAILQDYSIAMYDVCCVQHQPETYVKDTWAEYRNYGGELRVDSSLVRIDECATFTYEDEYSFADVCFSSKQSVAYFSQLTTEGICTSLTEKVNIGGEALQNLDLTFLTGGEELIPMVGNSSKPVYGCGGGKVRAFQLVVFLWFKNTVYPLALTMIIVGVVSILGTLLGCASLGLTSSKYDMNMDMKMVEQYLNQRNSIRVAELASYSATSSANAAGTDITRRSIDRKNFVAVSRPNNVDDKI